MWLGSVSGLQLPGNVEPMFHDGSRSPLISLSFEPHWGSSISASITAHIFGTVWCEQSFVPFDDDRPLSCKSRNVDLVSPQSSYVDGLIGCPFSPIFVPWGEALNPGPSLAINLTNPTGVRSK